MRQHGTQQRTLYFDSLASGLYKALELRAKRQFHRQIWCYCNFYSDQTQIKFLRETITNFIQLKSYDPLPIHAHARSPVAAEMKNSIYFISVKSSSLAKWNSLVGAQEIVQPSYDVSPQNRYSAIGNYQRQPKKQLQEIGS